MWSRRAVRRATRIRLFLHFKFESSICRSIAKTGYAVTPKNTRYGSRDEAFLISSCHLDWILSSAHPIRNQERHITQGPSPQFIGGLK